MNALLSIPPHVRYAILFLLGALVGGQVNRAIYRFAWKPRLIGPWSPPHADVAQRHWSDRVPILGWVFLRREASVHGPRFWIRPALIELLMGVGFPLLYWWELTGALLPPLPGLDAAVLVRMIHCQYLLHVTVLSLITAATFIDFDEQTIPDAITVPGTAAALIFAAILPASRLPIVKPLLMWNGQIVPAVGWHLRGIKGPAQLVDHLLLTSPRLWASWLDKHWGLVIALACFALWIFAILPWIWTTRRGICKAVVYLIVSILRHRDSLPRLTLGVIGAGFMIACWCRGGIYWQSLLTALIGLAFGGGLTWAVRIVGSSALDQEAMGFGDVTLMAMIGAFLGWQAALIIFFMAPFAAVAIAVTQFLLTRRNDIAFGPYLSLSCLVLIVFWGPVWYALERIFYLGWYVPIITALGLLFMWGMLVSWRTLKECFFAGPR